MKKVIIDCDPGVGISGVDADDALAILLALKSKEIKVEGVTVTFGNVEAELGARCALKVLEVAGRTDIPVAKGMSLPLRGQLHPEVEKAYSGPRGREGVIKLPDTRNKLHQNHAIDFIISKVMESPGEITLIPIGPQTNIALAILKEPRFSGNVKEIIMMGGAAGVDPLYGRGNVTPVAELNIWHDPEAAKIVFRSGIPVTMVGLDVTNPAKRTVLYEDRLTDIKKAGTPVADFVFELCNVYIRRPMFEWVEKPGCILYDPLAVAVAIDRTLVKTKKMYVDVETEGQTTAGETVVDVLGICAKKSGKGSNVDVCVNVDGERFIDFFVERITQP